LCAAGALLAHFGQHGAYASRAIWVDLILFYTQTNTDTSTLPKQRK